MNAPARVETFHLPHMFVDLDEKGQVASAIVHERLHRHQHAEGAMLL